MSQWMILDCLCELFPFSLKMYNLKKHYYLFTMSYLVIYLYFEASFQLQCCNSIPVKDLTVFEPKHMKKKKK